MIKFHPAIALALSMGGCSTIHSATEASTQPPAKPDCLASVLLDTPDSTTPCDMNPPLTISFLFTGDDALCDDAGGDIFTNATGQHLCFDADY